MCSTTDHPNTVTLEKPHSRWLRDDDTIVLHDLDNITLIKDSANKTKGNLPPSAAPMTKRAMELKKRVEHKPPCQGYHAEVEHEWRALERAQDNLRPITLLASLKRKGRVAAGQDVDVVRATLAMETTGIWDGKTLVKSNSIRKLGLFFTRGQNSSVRMNDDGNPVYPRWTQEQWAQLQDVVAQIEADPVLNPHGLRMPRLGKQRVFWPWRSDTCPVDVDSDYFFDEFRARLTTMDEACDKHHVTVETPATMFVEYMVQWYQTGGKCHVFGFEMVPYCGHFANYSFGRGLQQRMDDTGTMRDIKPGDHMKTGCTDLFPTDIKAHYDIKRRTVVCESWRANVMRWRYPGKPDILLPILEQNILDLCDETDWYHGVQEIDKYYAIPLPTKYKRSGDWIQSFVPAEDADDFASTADVQDDEGVDDEVEFLEAVIAEAHFAQIQSSDAQAEEEPQTVPEPQPSGDLMDVDAPETSQASGQTVDPVSMHEQLRDIRMRIASDSVLRSMWVESDPLNRLLSKLTVYADDDDAKRFEATMEKVLALMG